jgi:D-sedoheptulose 7-phosphate isomerase
MREYEELIELYLNEQIAIARCFPVAQVAQLAEWLLETYHRDATVYTFANGGPAGLADGFATDLKIHPFVSEDKNQTVDIRRLKVVCLNDSCSVITGVSNDLGYEQIFAEQLKNHLRSPQDNQDDLIVAFSGSGNSKNVLRAFEYARSFGVKTVCIAGRTGGKAKELADLCIIIPGSSRFPGQTGGNDNNFHIEDFQSSITHMVTGILKQKVMEGYALQH